MRGSVERRYRLHRARAVIDADAAAAMTPGDYRRAFAVGMATLLAEFNAYLDRDDTDPVADLVGFRQHALWLSPDELADMIAELRAVIASRMSHELAFIGPLTAPDQPDPVPRRSAPRAGREGQLIRVGPPGVGGPA
ncbi:hypothetical protein [Streptomyces sp. NPDC053560]|uniref:hypothetical protein n=1 Tax=Streptomyces sp. NPDC053560 TaxID=3365711 RepID=UPI0037CF9AC1